MLVPDYRSNGFFTNRYSKNKAFIIRPTRVIALPMLQMSTCYSDMAEFTARFTVHNINIIFQFTFIGNTPHRNVPFQIIWGDNKPLDNPENIQGLFI